MLYRALRELGEVDLIVVWERRQIEDEEIAVMQRDFGLVEVAEPVSPAKRGPLRWLSQINHKVGYAMGYHLARRGSQFSPDPVVSESVRRCVAEHDYDLFVGRYLLPTVQAGLPGRHPLVVDIDDVDSDIYLSRLNVPGATFKSRMVVRNQVRQLRRIERDAYRQIDHALVTNESDLEKIEGQVPASVLANVPFKAEPGSRVEASAPSGAGQRLLMVGSLAYKVNARGLDRFVANVWPRIHAELPEAVFRIVGVGMSDEQRERWGAVDGVEPVGFVEELAPEYDSCAATVVPIFEGGGTKIKVVESLMHGRPVVASSHAGRGYCDVLGVEHGLFVAQTEQEMAAMCCRLLSQPDARMGAFELGRDAVDDQFGYGQFRNSVHQAVDAAIDHAGRSR